MFKSFIWIYADNRYKTGLDFLIFEIALVYIVDRVTSQLDALFAHSCHASYRLRCSVRLRGHDTSANRNMFSITDLIYALPHYMIYEQL